MLHLLRIQKTIALLVALCGVTQGYAQREWNRPDHDNWPYYFGMTLGYTRSSIHTNKSTTFIQNDSIYTVEPGAGGGITLGLLGTLKLSNRFEVRANPQLIVGGARTFTYRVKYPFAGQPEVTTQTLPSTIVSFPFQVKFNSDRIDNFRVYMLAGIKYDIDLASNNSVRNAENLVKLRRSDYGVDVGIGFNFYLPFVTVSPEIKFSNGLANIHARDAALKFSNVLDRLNSQMITFSLHLED